MELSLVDPVRLLEKWLEQTTEKNYFIVQFDLINPILISGVDSVSACFMKTPLKCLQKARAVAIILLYLFIGKVNWAICINQYCAF